MAKDKSKSTENDVKSEKSAPQGAQDPQTKTSETQNTQPDDQAQDKNQQKKTENASQQPATEPDPAEEERKANLEAELTRQGQSGNPFLHSSDGKGRPYNPEIDGAPGEEAERKQREHDDPNYRPKA